MTNLTLSVDEAVLRRAHIRALELGTSVNALVRDFLDQLVGESAEEGVAEFLEVTQGSGAGTDSGGRSWTRDDLYDR